MHRASIVVIDLMLLLLLAILASWRSNDHGSADAASAASVVWISVSASSDSPMLFGVGLELDSKVVAVGRGNDFVAVGDVQILQFERDAIVFIPVQANDDERLRNAQIHLFLRDRGPPAASDPMPLQLTVSRKDPDQAKYKLNPNDVPLNLTLDAPYKKIHVTPEPSRSAK